MIIKDHPVQKLLTPTVLGEWYDATHLSGMGFLRLQLQHPYRLEALSYKKVSVLPERVTSYFVQYTDPDVRTKLLPNELVYLRFNVDQNLIYKGVSPLRYVKDMVAQDKSITQFTIANMVKNGGGLIFMPEDETTMSEEEHRGLKSLLSNAFRGLRAGATEVISQKLKLIELKGAIQSLHVKELRHTPEERICAVFGVPPVLANLGTGLETTQNQRNNYASPSGICRNNNKTKTRKS